MRGKILVLAGTGIFLLAANAFGQQGNIDKIAADQSLPAALMNPPLTGTYLPGAQPFGGAAAFDAFSVVTGEPFRAAINVRRVLNNPDGTKTVSEYHGITARDSQGRVFREQLASPKVTGSDGRGASFNAQMVTVSDPVAENETHWSDSSKIAYQSATRPFQTKPQPLDRCEADQIGAAYARSNPNRRNQRSEVLGERTIQGILTRGCRIYTFIPADSTAHKEAVTIIEESWTSPVLRAVLLRTRRDPGGEDEIAELDNLVRGEPGAAVFQIPKDYRLLDPKGEDLPTPAYEAEKRLHPLEFSSPISVERRDDLLAMTIDAARPLQIAVDFLRLKYGWKIDYEDPPFVSELIDAGDPKWQTAHQPAPKPGTMIPAGGQFQSEYSETLGLSAAPDAERQILEKIVGDYNRSGNPGKFIVRQESENRFAVIGVAVKNQDGRDKSVTPVLDTPITIPTAERSGQATVELILAELSKSSGAEIKFFGLADNGLMQRKVTVGGENVAARTLLLQVIGEKAVTRNWSLLYDANDGGFYGFNLGGYSIRSAPAAK